ncbi:hypothetical protein BIW11_05803 [Tropilaelaps mercedesae]|uniref:Uncharacterized protein n=1 Tax=Tropilaelaps mercedesae TaxID=418985 RepID=A0A1V9Y0T1_9ACAR|nr:hypothetical protein BIW11_05803 [Tropilaelaps mercedesae]
MTSWILLSALVLAPECSASLEEGLVLLEEITRFLTKKILPIAQEVLFDVDISSECTGSLLKFMSALRKDEPWALKSK